MSNQETTQTAPGNGAEPEAAPPGTTIEKVEPKPLSLRDPGKLARAFAESGYWDDVTKPAQAVVKIAAGEELGLTPLASMQGITIIEGNVGYTGNLINQLITQHPRYSVKRIERTNERCTLQFLIDGKPPADEPEEGIVTFTIEDAECMELVKPRSGWVKTPRSMCFYRCLTEGARVYFPDLTLGTPVYSTEEVREIVHVASTVEPVADATPAGLDDEKVDHLYALIENVKPALDAEGINWHDGLCVRLGALGVDAFDPAAPLRDELARLTAQQFEALDADLQGLAEAKAAEAGQGGDEEVADAELVEGQEGDEADA